MSEFHNFHIFTKQKLYELFPSFSPNCRLLLLPSDDVVMAMRYFCFTWQQIYFFSITIYNYNVCFDAPYVALSFFPYNCDHFG